MAEVVLTKEAAEQAAELPRTIQGRIAKLVERLALWPDVSGVKSLSGELAGAYRMRTGDYRLLFTIKGETVRIERIGHRDGFYEG